MSTQIIGAIVLFLTLAVGIYRWVRRMKSEKRKLADEAKASLDKANKDGNESDFLDGFGDINHASR